MSLAGPLPYSHSLWGTFSFKTTTVIEGLGVSHIHGSHWEAVKGKRCVGLCALGEKEERIVPASLGQTVGGSEGNMG